jgi:hypothetical protein
MKGSWILVLALVAGSAELAHADDPPTAPSTRWPMYIGVAATILGITVGTVAASDASDQAEQARGLFPTDPRFKAARHAFERDRGIAVAALSMAAVGVGFATSWSVIRLRDTRVTATVGSGQAMLSIEHVR